MPESDTRVRGQMKTGDTVDQATANPQIAGGRDVTRHWGAREFP